MKVLKYLVILGALGYGIFYLYQTHHFDSFFEGVNNTTARTTDYVTDKAINEM